MTIKERLEVLLEPLIAESDCFLIDVVIKPSKASTKVMILADSDEGITIQQCTSISRQLAKQLEDEDIFPDAYTLEVSSPGLDQPLVLPRQYKKNIGRNLKATLKSGETITGTIQEANEASVQLLLAPPKKKSKTPVTEAELTRTIPLDEVAKAMIEISFK
ncbi:ribosome maturation factor RimP [Dyadobacter sandarakinus]|uniref:Ribosome maturation factor RimP n=2 Tax=Dyadobacter sandarakinus TaxID=2747268 RepID=A0ABX7ICY2_9BACT|nr:ribosome maturation factor RimP [Dyadobacter sandarakinus]